MSNKSFSLRSGTSTFSFSFTVFTITVTTSAISNAGAAYSSQNRNRISLCREFARDKRHRLFFRSVIGLGSGTSNTDRCVQSACAQTMTAVFVVCVQGFAHLRFRLLVLLTPAGNGPRPRRR